MMIPPPPQAVIDAHPCFVERNGSKWVAICGGFHCGWTSYARPDKGKAHRDALEHQSRMRPLVNGEDGFEWKVPHKDGWLYGLVPPQGPYGDISTKPTTLG